MKSAQNDRLFVLNIKYPKITYKNGTLLFNDALIYIIIGFLVGLTF